MHYFSQSSIFCVHPSAAAGLRQDFVNDRNGEILLCVTLPCITVRSFAERLRGWGAIGVVSQRYDKPLRSTRTRTTRSSCAPSGRANSQNLPTYVVVALERCVLRAFHAFNVWFELVSECVSE